MLPTKKLYLYSMLLEKRDKVTLILSVQIEIELKTTFFSNQHLAYSALKYIGFHHEIMDYSEFFLSIL